jgi:hypothetical protein
MTNNASQPLTIDATVSALLSSTALKHAIQCGIEADCAIDFG